MSWHLYNSSRLHQAKKKKKKGPVDDQQALVVSTSSQETKSLIVAPSSKQTLEFSKRWILATASLSLAMVIVVFSTTDELSVRFGTTRADGSNFICSTTNYIVSTAADHTARTTTVTSFLRESSGDEEQEEERQTVYSASNTNLTKTTTTTTPKVAWLMSFPNSGTSYTLNQIRSVSGTTTATNYGNEGQFQNQPSIPIHPGAEKDGPFLQLTAENTTIPSKYILTKTHCAGYCSDCTPDGYVETPRSFQMLCQSGRKYVVPLDEGNSNNLDLIEVTYDADLVGKAVHVIRNPLDNIVARYHLMWNRYNGTGDDERWISKHPNDVTGFKRWCSENDKRSELPNMRWVDERLKALFKKIPCHEEFFRYVQWHNLAFSLTRDLGIPSLIINYQDYRDDLDGTTDRLLNFLELERKGPNLPFVHGKEYKDYYTPEERKGIEAFVMEYATDDTWQNVRGHEFLS